jgi:hypothetical protein
MRNPTPTTLLRLLLVALILPACGSGTLAIFGGGGGGGGGNAPPVVGDVLVGADPTDAKTSPVTFTFKITDAESSPVDIDVLYVPPGGGPPVPVLLAGNTNLDQLASSPAGVVHTRQWDFAPQVPSGGAYAPGYRLTVRTRNQGSSADSALFAIGNDPPVVSNVSAPSGETSGIVPVSFDLADSSSDLVSVTVEYQDVDNPTGWRPATSAGGPLTNVATDPSGVPLFFFWDVPADAPAVDFRAVLRFTPDDGTATGIPVTSPTLILDNNAVPTALVNGSAFYATPDKRRGIPLPIRILDPEDDTVRVVVQWRTAFGTFPDLPQDAASVLGILSSSRLRRQYQIATEAPISFSGPLVPTGPSAARLGQIQASQAGILAGGIAGRELRILRSTHVPAPAAAGWSSNPLSSPVAVLPLREGHSALVLDSPSALSWRLREIDLATGAVVQTVGSGSGDPDGLAWEDPDASALVACDSTGIWSVLRADLAAGTTTNLITTSGSSAVGKVHGIVSLGTGKALLTVANSLVAIDAANAGPPLEHAFGAAFQGPYGIALDPHNRNRLYLAERDWVNPATSTVDGHVVAIDLLSRTRKGVAATGFPFLHPDSIAVDETSGRLLVLTDANPSDGTREIRAVDLNGGGGGQAFQIASGIPDGCQGLAAGPDGLRVLALTPSSDLSVAGGVEQLRTITAFDGVRGEATVGSAFAPALDAGRTWRIVDALDPMPAPAGGVDGTFVWDSSDLLAGGDVVLRAVPYDTEQGLSTDTGVPRPIRVGLDVVPYSIGSAASTSAPSSIAMADLDGDGKPDLATANVGSDNITLFFQGSGNVFPSTPSATLTGVPLLVTLTDPYSVKAIDVDGDGDLDVVSANHGSNNLVIWTQGSPGSFSAVIPALGGLTAPSDVAGADLNGDGRMDLVAANTGANRLSIFFRNNLGGYPGSPSLSVGNASTGSPVSVAVGDLDGDGEIDLVSANQSTNNVTVFLQGAPGVFPAAPSAVLGGPGLTDGPVSVAVGDVDGDGRLDIACADETGNNLTVFLQSSSGGFGATPTFTLAGAGSPLQPTHVELADVNDDGTLDLVSCNGGNDISIFVFQADTGTFASQPIVIGQNGSLSSPSSIAVGDADGDGHVDLAASNSAGNDVSVFQQVGGASYAITPADLVLGDAITSTNPGGIAVVDLDGDGDLDIVTANEGGNSLSIFEQLSPSIFGSSPAQVLGSATDTPGPRAVAAADLDGDGRMDLVSANRAGGTLAIFHQLGSGGFSASPDVVLGGGTLGAPTSIAVGDLDGDGRPDLVCANATANNLSVFLQPASGGFAGVSPATIGSGATTKAPAQVLVVDIDGDGDLDIVSANTTGDNVTIFLNPGNGVFPAAPSLILGATASTPSPRAVAVGDLDGDGDLDIAVACGGNNRVAIFLQGAPGSFPAAPSATLTSASLTTPDTIAVADVDHDGDVDIVTGNTGSRNLTLFRQGLPGVFSATPIVVGGAGCTDSPRSLFLVDLDGDGDVDMVSAQPTLDNVVIFFGSH